MVTIIVAMGLNREIGRDNKLLWHLPSDLKRFKALTIGKTVVMGRKTFESIGKALPNRENIILSRNKIKGYKVLHSVKEVLSLGDIVVIGGEEIYKQFLPFTDVIELTTVFQSFEDADTHFPQFEGFDLKEEELMEGYKNQTYEKTTINATDNLNGSSAGR